MFLPVSKVSEKISNISDGAKQLLLFMTHSDPIVADPIVLCQQINENKVSFTNTLLCSRSYIILFLLKVVIKLEISSD